MYACLFIAASTVWDSFWFEEYVYVYSVLNCFMLVQSIPSYLAMVDADYLQKIICTVLPDQPSLSTYSDTDANKALNIVINSFCYNC